MTTTWRGASPLARRCVDVLEPLNHGDRPRWLAALADLPAAVPRRVSLDDCVTFGHARDLDAAGRAQLADALRGLKPWRKGPFRLFGVQIDAEWRSDLKWARIAPHVDLDGAHVLDVGCGNGYYGWRMLEAGAASVTGIDPSLLFVLQHAAVAYYADDPRNLVLPLTLEDVEPGRTFDTVFSMGVVYHRRDPAAHIRALARHAHRDTVVVLESLVVDGSPIECPDRYARMPNVHLIPDVATLAGWLGAAGFATVRLVDRSVTTSAEQRSTPWMTYQSLADALDPADPTRTVEGYPAPERAVMIASR
ncbi:MAG: tRNA 5-methoxyuridine(34)/uridine 5-oxyacetic acid(34) synthase CmoB [Gammaproteobacteria bacterium]|nr:tRNA 5-methoxyuridine(34)/uridine 5-oxyacetic acid(34) synthase CmoB [Gammaproteobacteria bacterium]